MARSAAVTSLRALSLALLLALAILCHVFHSTDSVVGELPHSKSDPLPGADVQVFAAPVVSGSEAPSNAVVPTFEAGPEDTPLQSSAPLPVAGPEVVDSPQERRVKVLVTFYENLPPEWVHPKPFPCPSVQCEITALPKGQVLLSRGDMGKLQNVDILQINANSVKHNPAYDVLRNPYKKFLMMFTWENRNRDMRLWLRPPNQWWIGYLWKTPELWSKFHITSAPEQGSDAPFNAWVDYINSPKVTPHLHYSKPSRAQKAKNSGLLSFIVGHGGRAFRYNDGQSYDRISFAKALDEHVQVDDVYGRIGRREKKKYRELGCWNDHWEPGSTMCIISNYHFHLTAENSQDWDYVSEKVYYPLWMGTVPVYIGAPNIENFVPPRSIIKVSDFPSIPALASYLKCLVEERPDLYDYYLAWRNRTAPYWERWKNMPHTLCRACQLVADNDPRLYNRTGKIPLPQKYILPDAEGLQAPFKECLKE